MEDKGLKKERVKKIVSILKKDFPNVRTALNFSNPLELLIATILSAQCTDERVNKVTSELFKKYKSAKDYADANLQELEKDIRSTGFYKNKAKTIKKCCGQIMEEFNGEMPSTLEELVQLNGVGRKTANVVLGMAYNIQGIVVDTHVKRVSNRLGLTEENDPVKIEFELMETIPKKDWTDFSFLLIEHGRKTCIARSPKCKECKIEKLCSFKDKNL
jgi:endonuclease-3